MEITEHNPNKEDWVVNRHLELDKTHQGDARVLLSKLEPDSVAVSIWSPPYHVGKNYEKEMGFEAWVDLLDETIKAHFMAVKPGGFIAINIADILVFKDDTMPRIQAENPTRHKIKITTEDVLRAKASHPSFNRYQLAELLGCSEQTVDRRLNGNNIRGGKYNPQTRVKLVGGLIEDAGLDAGFYLYDRRVWVKDPAWENSRWHSLSYRAVDEFEYVYIFWKPGVTKVNRERLSPEEWKRWGSRAVWYFPSVRRNDIHEAMFPLELPRRLIKLFTDPGEIVLDPFMGSGTTALAAIEEGRHYVGIELLPEYVALAERRCAEKKKQGKLVYA